MFANDITINGRSEEDNKKSFTVIKTPADAMGIKVNEEKTKYMIVTGNRKQTMVEKYITIMEYKFNRVWRFAYLGY